MKGGNSVDRGTETVFTVGVPETTTHKPSNLLGKEATMAQFVCSPALADKLGIRHDWTVGKSAARVASAAGMPGFGARYAAERLALVESGSHTLHEAFLGRR